MKKEKIVVHDELLAKVGVALRRAAKRAKGNRGTDEYPDRRFRKRKSGQEKSDEEIGSGTVVPCTPVSRHPGIITSRGKNGDG